MPGNQTRASSLRGATSGPNTPATTARTAAPSWWWVAPAAGVAVILLLLLPVAGRSRLRRRRQQRSLSGHGEAEWQELLDTATDLGIATVASQSPRGVGQQLASRLDGPPAVALERLASAEELRRYARPQEAPRTDGFGDVAVVSAGLRQSVRRRARLRALFLPRSWFRRQAAAARRVAGRLSRAPSPSAGRKVEHAGG